ncbi:tetraprenyl-beta-curcumene synthase family protein [Litchfieldia alkalitelluris]|uniref:tetraprenyl-beta-curcumene synthase family protein n=1 Tax=Litchfieldia alkalitelluris TaxID=304268 RepID=UPI000996E7CD|nr:tetraprenyl-beta-curcumene synthase family protein [Litchfieldia alkalitelluris]
MKVPTHPFPLMGKVYNDVIPTVHKYLGHWRKKAENIPNPELRKQALASIDSKTFHCEGGSIMAILAHNHMEQCIKFIVAYQTISDYLDNLCDRSTSLDPVDFRALHESMPHALTIGQTTTNYYRYRNEQDDGGYLEDLVQTCQEALAQTFHYEKIVTHLKELAGYYCDLQVHKHVEVKERVPRLEQWFEHHKPLLPEMEWYEFSACSGSTLGIFCLVAHAFQDEFEQEAADKIRNGYFPYIQGLHILLDYLIDQEEDRKGGDLNFCFYYPHEEKLIARLKHFVLQADKHISGLPNEKFHKLINRGLLGIYLSDEKVRKQKKVSQIAKEMIKCGGSTSYFFYMNGRAYRTFQKVSGVFAR